MEFSKRHCIAAGTLKGKGKDNPPHFRTYGAALNYFVNFLGYYCPENPITVVAEMKYDTGEWKKGEEKVRH